MSAYDFRDVTLVQPSDPAVLGAMRLGVARLGATTSALVDAPISAASIAAGYDVGQLGELSIDPVSAAASLSLHGEGSMPDVSTPPLDIGAYVELRYAAAVLFQGIVVGTAADVTSSGEAGTTFDKALTYALLGTDAISLGRSVAWNALPAEGAIARLRRWFTVDTSDLPASLLSLLYEPVAAQDAGQSTLLDQARAFTERTLLPVALDGSPRRLRVLAGATFVDGADPPVTAGTADARAYTYAWSYGTRARYASLLLSAAGFPDAAAPTDPPTYSPPYQDPTNQDDSRNPDASPTPGLDGWEGPGTLTVRTGHRDRAMDTAVEPGVLRSAVVADFASSAAWAIPIHGQTWSYSTDFGPGDLVGHVTALTEADDFTFIDYVWVADH